MGFDAVISAVPGLAAVMDAAVVGQLEPAAATDLSKPLRGLVSFCLVLGSGAVVLQRRQDYVNEAISAISDSPATAVLYGIAGYAILGLVGLYGATTLASLSVVGGVLVRLGVIASSVLVLGLTGFGFLVVGTLLTDVCYRRRPSHGLLIGASLSAVPWFLFSPVGGIASSLAVAAFGIGGSVRVWIHSERTVETEVGTR